MILLTTECPAAWPSQRDGFFDLSAIATLSAVDEADTVIVPNRPDVDVPRLIGFGNGADQVIGARPEFRSRAPPRSRATRRR